MQPEKVVNRTLNLFEDTAQCQSRLEELCRGAIVLRAFALTDEAPVLAALGDVIAEAPSASHGHSRRFPHNKATN